jgi:Glycosyl hydrolases family 16
VTTPGPLGPDPVLDRTGFDLAFADDFAGPGLDQERWLAHYLPHWTTPERSAARYAVGARGLELLVEADQPAWRDEDGPLRVSNLQTGSFSGPAGSGRGQHRHRPGLTVRSPQPTRRLWTPSSGLVEATMSASGDPTCMLALWLVGLEARSPQDSGEICIAELFGHAVGPAASRVRLGVKAHHDPRLRTEMTDLVLDIDATQEHTYAAAWDAASVRFYVDDALVHSSDQGVDYELQLMVDLFEFPDQDARPAAHYPKSARVRRIRGYAGPAGAG